MPPALSTNVLPTGFVPFGMISRASVWIRITASLASISGVIAARSLSTAGLYRPSISAFHVSNASRFQSRPVRGQEFFSPGACRYRPLRVLLRP